MSDLTYSNKALNTLSEFHEKRHVIYVEGEDDLIFWDTIFKHAKLKNYYLKIAGGEKEIDKYAIKIVNNNVNVIAARDSHYSFILKTNFRHPRILYTYGYSIENSLYNPRLISSIISALSRKIIDLTQEVEDWYKRFENELAQILVLDIANEQYQKGISVMGDNCCRFLSNNNSISLSASRITGHYDKVGSNFTHKEILDVESLLNKSKYEKRYIIRGHFLSPAILNLIKFHIRKIGNKKISFSYDALFGNCISRYSTECKNSVDMQFYNKQIKALENSTSS